MTRPNTPISPLRNSLNKLVRRARVVNEKLRGLDFSSVTEPGELGLDETTVFRGSPPGDTYLKNPLKDMKIGPNDSILDIGCAKGSALRCMLNFPFSRVDGIELSSELAQTARDNFSKLKKSHVEIFNTNAIRFDHYGDYNFFYLYNPFPESVMTQVMDRLTDQLDRSREIIIIYNNPKSHAVLVNQGFTMVREFPDLWGNGIFVYSNSPLGSRLR